MVKKAKSFSKIFTVGEVRKGLLASSSKDEDEAPDRSETAGSFEDEFPLDNEFPLAPASGRAAEEDDIFAETTTGKKKNEINNDNFDKDDVFDFPESGADFAVAGGAFAAGGDFSQEVGSFPDGGAFLEAGTFEKNSVDDEYDGFADFAASVVVAATTANDDEDSDDEDHDEDPELDEPDIPDHDRADKPDHDNAAFFASFSNLEKAQEAMQQQPHIAAEDERKKTRSLIRLFNKKKDLVPIEHVARCAEIVVNKSKIPTTKIEMELVNGELVTPKHSSNLQEAALGEEGEKKSRLKSLTKTLKNKAAGLGVGMPSIPKNPRIEDNSQQDLFDAVEDKNSSESESQDADGAEMADGSQNRDGGTKQRIRNRRRQGGDPLPSETQRRARRHGAESRLDGQKIRHKVVSDGAGGRRTVHKDDLASSNRVRRTRTEESTGGSHRRHQTVDKSQTSPRRTSSKPSITSDGMDDSKKQREMSDGSGTHRNSGSRRHRDNTGHRDTTGKKQPMRRLATLETPRRSKSGDGMSSSSHHGIRRMQTDMTMANRRAKSTRHINMGESSLKETSHRLSSAYGRDGLSNRDRLRRASVASERNLVEREDKEKREALGNLFGGGFGMDKEKSTGPKGRSRAGSDGDRIQEILEESENESETEMTEAELAMDASGLNLVVEKSGVMKNGTTSGKKSAAEALNNALSGNCLSKEEVEKLVRAVAYQAKNARDEHDIEAIVMGALGGESTTLFRDFCDPIDEEDEHDDVTDGSDIGESGRTFSAKDVQERARVYVNKFLKSSGAISGFKEAGRRQAGKNYTGVLKCFGGTNAEFCADGGDDSRINSEGKNEDDVAEEIGVLDGAISKLAGAQNWKPQPSPATSRQESTKDDAKPRERISVVDIIAKRRDIVKAAKVPDKDNNSTKLEGTKSSGKVDFSAVTARLEAKVDAKNRTRTRAQHGVVAK
jgi:hypothetical protein